MFDNNKKQSGGLILRTTIIIIVFVIMALIIIQRLFTLQIIKGEDYLDNFALSIKKTKVLPSTRGEIYDRNGKLLAYNQLAYNVTFEDNGTYNTTHEHNLTLNGILYRATKMIEEHGDEMTTSFRIALNENGQYQYTVKGFNLSRFKADVFGRVYIDDMTDEEANITASDLMKLLCSTKYYGIVDEKTTAAEREEYGLPADFTDEEVLQLVAMRSALAQNSYQRYNSITIAKDVSRETVLQLMENKDTMPGIDVADDYLRVYNNAEYFSQIIGYTGRISGEELKTLNEEKKGRYSNGDIVGKVGIEQVMETSLQGDKGSETLYVDTLGRPISTESIVQPQAGNSLYLTLDTDLQIASYKILEEYIAGILWANIIDAKEFNTDYMVTSDDYKLPVYDVYFALFENNMLDVNHLSAKDATENEKEVYRLFENKSEAIFNELKDQLTRSDPTPYNELTEEYKVYQSYIVNNMLQTTGILNADAIDKSDLTWKAWSEDEKISLQELLTYAISKNWIDINGVVENTEYLDSDEIYTALSDYIQSYLFKDTDFTKRVFRYMLMDDTLSPTQVCQLLFDQNVLTRNEDDYNRLADGSISAYDFIREKIYNLEITPAQLALTPCSGSVVITDPDSGDVIACVSYPGYDNNRLVNDMDTSYYNKLVTDLASPFYSRATQEVLAPGSTFKPITATAGVMEGVVSIYDSVFCTGNFEYIDPPIKCWVYPGSHGTETLTTALRDSCNFYFNTVAFRLAQKNNVLSEDGSIEYQDEVGVAALQKYASMYGLDAKSGVEVPETSPHLATYAAVPMGMGQSDNAFTVTQLARYVNTIANSGTAYDLTLIGKVTDSNGNTIEEKDPVVHSTVDLPQDLWDAIHTGMREMAKQHSVLKDYNEVTVAGKTGTAQESTIKPNHALFIGYAPYEDPEISIAVRVANGYTSANTASIAKDVLSYYFKTRPTEDLLTGHAMQVTEDNTRTD